MRGRRPVELEDFHRQGNLPSFHAQRCVYTQPRFRCTYAQGEGEQDKIVHHVIVKIGVQGGSDLESLIAASS